MKVLALGGCGLMGKHFVATAIKLGAFDRMTIADLNFAAAEHYVNSLAHPNIDALSLDAMNPMALRQALAHYDVVVSTIGPYFLFGTRVLDAAIDAGCNYIDICDDPEPTLEMLDLHEKARTKGVTALIGMGASPGIVSLLAASAIANVGTVDRVVTTWGSTSRAKEKLNTDQEMGAALDHWIEQFTGTIPSYQNGAIVRVKPLQTIALSVPGLGRVKVTTVGHPEPMTLPRTYPTIKTSMNAMVFSNELIALLRVVQGRVDRQGHSIRQAADLFMSMAKPEGLASLSIFENVKLVLSGISESLFGRRYMPSEMTAIAEGTASGRRRISSAWMNGEILGGMGPNTCIPTAIALQMMFEKKLNKYGVFSPEALIDPIDFFSKLKPFVTLNKESNDVLTLRQAWA